MAEKPKKVGWEPGEWEAMARKESEEFWDKIGRALSDLSTKGSKSKEPQVVVIANYEQLAAAIARNIVEMQNKKKPTGPNLKVKNPGEVIQ